MIEISNPIIASRFDEIYSSTSKAVLAFITDDFQLLFGTQLELTDESREVYAIPDQVRIRAVATFNDGKTQEETITINVGGGELFGANAEGKRIHDLLYSIPLEECEIDQERVLEFGDEFEFEYYKDHFFGTTWCLVTEESMNSAMRERRFDENGIYRLGANMPDDGRDGYISAIRNNGDGTYSGIHYRVPGWLILAATGQ